MPDRRSFVNENIVAALEGRFGDVHRSERAAGMELFVSPLMSSYWHIDQQAVAGRSLYLDQLNGTQSIFDVQQRIEAFRGSVSARPRRAIPC
jgi:hypothetical protein